MEPGDETGKDKVRIIIKTSKDRKESIHSIPGLEMTFAEYMESCVGKKSMGSNNEIQLILENPSGTSNMFLSERNKKIGEIVCNGTQLKGIIIQKKKGSLKSFFNNMFKPKKGKKEINEKRKNKKLQEQEEHELDAYQEGRTTQRPLTTDGFQLTSAVDGTVSSDKKKKKKESEQQEAIAGPLVPIFTKSNKDAIIESSPDLQNILTTYCPVGIKNIGNTCFMSSTLQLLFRCKDFIKPFITSEIEATINSKAKLGSGGDVTRALGRLIQNYIIAQQSEARMVSPRQFFSVFKKRYKQFASFGMHQDAQEFVGSLLDVLHEDTNKVTEKPIVDNKVEGFIPGQNITASVLADISKKIEMRDNSKIFNQFNSVILSTVRCINCNTVSTRFEPCSTHMVPIIARDIPIVYVIMRRRDKDGNIPPPIAGTVPIAQEIVPFRRVVLEIGKQHPELTNLHLVGVRFSVIDNLSDRSYHLPTICYAQPDMVKAGLFTNNPDAYPKVLVISEVEHNPVEKDTYLAVCNINLFNESRKDESEPMFTYQSLPFVISLKTPNPTQQELDRAIEPFIGELNEFVCNYGGTNTNENEEDGEGSNKIATSIQSESIVDTKDSKPPPDNEKKKRKKKVDITVETFYCSYNERECMLDSLLGDDDKIIIPEMTRDPKIVKKAGRSCGRIDGFIRCVLRPSKTLDILDFKVPTVSDIIQKMKDVDKEKAKLVKKAKKANDCQAEALFSVRKAIVERSMLRKPTGNITVQECLEDSLKSQFLSGDNKYYCSVCKDHMDAVNDRQCIKWPRYLLITLKRFNQNMYGISKNHNPVSITKYLILNEGNREVRYDILGMAIHLGHLTGGHYISYVRGSIEESQNTWYLCNDDSVSKVKSLDVSQSYIILYERNTN